MIATQSLWLYSWSYCVSNLRMEFLRENGMEWNCWFLESNEHEYRLLSHLEYVISYNISYLTVSPTPVAADGDSLFVSWIPGSRSSQSGHTQRADQRPSWRTASLRLVCHTRLCLSHSPASVTLSNVCHNCLFLSHLPACCLLQFYWRGVLDRLTTSNA